MEPSTDPAAEPTGNEVAPGPDDTTALAGLVLAAPGLAVAAQRVVDAVARAHGVDRCTLGVWSGDDLRLVASSASDLAASAASADEHDPLRLGAMHEALSQGVALACPAAAADGASAPIGHEHRLLHEATGAAVACVPAGADGIPLAVLCVERRAGRPPIDEALLRRLQAALRQAAPALHWLARSERGLGAHVRAELAGGWQALRRPDRTLRRRLLAAGAAALAVACLVPVERDVGGRARIEGRLQQVVSVPMDGFMKAAWVRPGDHVKAGQPLVDLVDGDLRLERERLASQLAQRENGYAEAMAQADRVGASSSLAGIAETQAQLGLVDAELGRGHLVAPFDGLVVQGDLAQAAGAPLKQGDPLLTLAADGAGERVVVDVDETDVGRLRPGQRGQASVSSLPWDAFDVTVERISPVARAVEGRNVFEVDARIDGGHPALRPGLLGRAHIAVGRAPLAVAWASRVLEAARLAWWSWLA